MEKLLLEKLWPEVRALARKAKRTEAAIAYFSSDEFLPLRSGSTLIVDASPNTIRTRGTSAKLLWKIRKKVRLYSLENLHAKMILLDNRLVVGSANASQTSVGRLHEAGILTDSPQIVSQARSYFYQLRQKAEPLTEQRLRKLKKIKLLRQHLVKPGRKRKFSAPGKRVWLVSVEDLDDTQYADEQKYVDQAEKRLRSASPDADPNSIRFSGKSRLRQSAANGDTLIVFSSEKRRKTPYDVLPPASLLLRQDRREWSRFYYDPELSAPLKSVDWPTFQKLLKQAGISRKVSPRTERELAFRDFVELHRLWPRKRR